MTGYTDASLGTGPKSKSVLGSIVKLNEDAGAIVSKASAGQCVSLSSFEAELDGTARLMKIIARIVRIRICGKLRKSTENIQF